MNRFPPLNEEEIEFHELLKVEFSLQVRQIQTTQILDKVGTKNWAKMLEVRRIHAKEY
jgi:hypothetical protein